MILDAIIYPIANPFASPPEFGPDGPSLPKELILPGPGPRPGLVWEVEAVSIYLRAFTEMPGGVHIPGAIDCTVYIGDVPVATQTQEDVPIPSGTMGPSNTTNLLQAVTAFSLLPGQTIQGKIA